MGSFIRFSDTDFFILSLGILRGDKLLCILIGTGFIELFSEACVLEAMLDDIPTVCWTCFMANEAEALEPLLMLLYERLKSLWVNLGLEALTGLERIGGAKGVYTC